jgi:hypothetical protein
VFFFSGGEVSEEEVEKHCEEYEQLITKCGGIDIQILGIGRTGHIGNHLFSFLYKSFNLSVSFSHLFFFQSLCNLKPFAKKKGSMNPDQVKRV